ncbi:TPA: DNA replication protein, partial [Klebsiella pneumoniae]|nr:DNA replication protein [Klebsiella pneumoniae]
MEKPQPSGQGLVFLHRKVRELPFYKTDSEAVHLW